MELTEVDSHKIIGHLYFLCTSHELIMRDFITQGQVQPILYVHMIHLLRILLLLARRPTAMSVGVYRFFRAFAFFCFRVPTLL